MTSSRLSPLLTLPLVPLLDVVLFPHSRVQLDLFESRYVTLAKEARQENSIIAVGRLTGGGSPVVEPPVFPMAGAARVDGFDEHAGGSITLYLTGVGRLHIDHEIVGRRPYRQVVARRVADEAAIVDDGFFEEFRALLLRANPAVVHQPQELLSLLDVAPPPGFFSDLAAHFLAVRPDQRQTLLEERNPARRLILLHDMLSRQLLELDSARVSA